MREIEHLLGKFGCENESINSYFKKKALKDDDATSFCFLTDDEETIIALSSLSCSAIIIESEKNLHLVPAVEVKMFAVNKEFQHKSMGMEIDETINWSTYCFDKLIGHINQFTEKHCGASRMVLYSVPRAVTFYERIGFKHFEGLMRPQDKTYLEECCPMYMVL